MSGLSLPILHKWLFKLRITNSNTSTVSLASEERDRQLVSSVKVNLDNLNFKLFFNSKLGMKTIRDSNNLMYLLALIVISSFETFGCLRPTEEGAPEW